MSERMRQSINPNFDPFSSRHTLKPLNDWDTYTLVIKAALGTGILGMPIAFMYSGIILGVFLSIFTAFISFHCSYILVECAHIHYYKTESIQFTFDQVVEVSFKNGPECLRGLANFAKIFTLLGLFITYFVTCSCYAVIIASNLQQVLEYYDIEVKLRIIIAALLIPLILICWIPKLKHLSPALALANLLMGFGLGVTCYYLCRGLPSISDREYAQVETLPQFFAITIFALAAIGVVMPLENEMKMPQHFLGLCGILSKGAITVGILYICIGFLGYLRYGPETAESITLNLPLHEIPAQSVKIFTAFSIYATFALQFYVCLSMSWRLVKRRWPTRFANYVLRTVLVIAAVGLALLVPTIAPFMGLIGAFCFSILGIILPAVIELITYWDLGYGPCKCMIFKDIFLSICGICALIFGTNSAIRDIYREVYSS